MSRLLLEARARWRSNARKHLGGHEWRYLLCAAADCWCYRDAVIVRAIQSRPDWKS